MTKVLKVIALGSLIATSALYSAGTAGCLGCHGASFEKKAMGKSKVVKDMSREDIIKSLNGYKDGSYGGPMKAIMKGQAAGMSEADITAFAAKYGKKYDRPNPPNKKGVENFGKAIASAVQMNIIFFCSSYKAKPMWDSTSAAPSNKIQVRKTLIKFKFFISSQCAGVYWYT